MTEIDFNKSIEEYSKPEKAGRIPIYFRPYKYPPAKEETIDIDYVEVDVKEFEREK